MATSSADKVAAQDFLEYLKELDDADARRIRFLTQMVDEQSEHAAAISEALKDYIQKTSPDRKLLALYVLDSIAKNLAGAFTQHLGRGLLDIYWVAYERAGEKGRRQLVNLLNSWENPGPGVSARNPVFSPEVTQPIRRRVNAAAAALARLNTGQSDSSQQLALASSAPHGHSFPGMDSWRYATPPQQHLRNTPMSSLTHPHAIAQHYHDDHHSNGSSNQNYYTAPPPQPPSLDNPQHIMSSLRHLIGLLQQTATFTPQNHGIHGKLDGLLKLQQAIEQNATLAPNMWAGIKRQVDMLMEEYHTTRMSQYDAHGGFLPPVTKTPTPQPAAQGLNAPVAASTPPVPHLPDANILAELSAKLGTSQQAAQHAGGAGQTQISSAPFMAPPASALTHPRGAVASLESTPWQASSDFLTQLSRLAGSLPAGQAPRGPTPASLATPAGLSGLSSLLGLRADIVLTQASIRQPRQDLFRNLWANKSQCKTCGRRFATTKPGREAKQRHMDYHFRTRMRMADTKQSLIATRSWFATEMEWIHFREVDDAEAAQELTNKQSTQKENVGDAKGRKADTTYVRVPSDMSKANKTCPICQEDFENSWHDGAQEWVWMDCTRGPDGRYFHSSCRHEVMKDEAAAKERESRAHDRAEREARQRQAAEADAAVVNEARAVDRQPVPSKSPDSVLGKRKAVTEEEDDDYEPAEHERRVSPRIDTKS